MDESNHPDLLNKGPWYNTAICSRLHGILFEYFITHARANRYNILCSLAAHDKKQHDYEDDEIIIGYRLIPKQVKTESLEALGASPNFIEIWLKLLNNNYDARRVAYSTSMIDMFKQIPTMMNKLLISRQKVKKLMT